MPIGFVKWLDRQVGLLLCAALQPLGLLRRLVRGRGGSTAACREVLVIKFWGLGSIVLATPLLRAIRAAHPQARITILTFSSNVQVFEAFGLGDRFRHFSLDCSLRALVQFWRLIGFVLLRRFDLVLDLEFFSRFTSGLTVLAGGRRAIGFHARHFWKGDFYTHRCQFNAYHHIMDNYLELGRTVGVDVAGGASLLPLPVEPAQRAAVDALLAAAGVRGPFVVLNPNAGPIALERRWPAERFRELARLILAEGREVVLIGAPEERPYVEALCRSIDRPGAHDLSGRLSLVQLAALFARSAAVVSSDTGPLHLAVAMGTPTVSLFGPETPVIYGPRGDRHRVLFRDLPCSPCLNVYNAKTVDCPFEVRCIREIEAREVFEQLAGLLEELEAPVGG